MSLQGNVAGQTLVGSINELYLLTISAYGVAVKNGFVGTEEEWLNSLKGKSAQIYVGTGEMPEGYAVQIDPTVAPYDYVQTVNGIHPDANGNVLVEGSGITADVAQAMIDIAISNLPPSGLTEEEAQSMIDEALAKLPPSGLTKAETQAMIDTALAGLPDGITTEEVQGMIDSAVANLPTGGLTAEEVQAMIDAALGGIENGTY